MLERNEMILREERSNSLAGYGAPRSLPMPPSMPDDTEPSFFGAILRQWWIVVFTVLIALGAAAAYLKQATPLYKGMSRMTIDSPRSLGEGPSSDRGNFLFRECELIKSPKVLSKILDLPEIKALPEFSKISHPLYYLRENLEADVERRTDVVFVALETPDPEESAAVVNKIIEAYCNYSDEQRDNTAARKLESVKKQQSESEHALLLAQTQVDEFTRTHPSLTFVKNGESLQWHNLLLAQEQYVRAQAELSKMEQTYGPGRREVQNARELCERFRLEYEQAYKDTKGIGDQEIQLLKLQREVQSHQAEVDQYRARIKELQIAVDAFKAPTITVLESAIPVYKPSSPQKLKILALAGIIGSLLGCGLALLRDKTDTRLRSIEEVQTMVGLPVLGVVPKMPARRTAVARAMAVHLDPRSEVAEAYRTVRTAVYFGQSNTRAKTLLVTSPEPGDGKTTSASNLAIAIAQTGRNILLLDADFRKPTQHKNLDVKDSVGLSSVLAGMETLERAIQRTGVDGLDILPCGPIPENPSEILNSQEFGELIDRLALKYDHILFDSPPCNLVTDARILGAVCDATILVLRAEKSTRKAAEHARNALLSVGAKVLGVIVNDVPRGKGYEVYGGAYYGTPEMRHRGTSSDVPADHAIARPSRPASGGAAE